MQLSSSNQPALHSQAHAETARATFALRQIDDHAVNCRSDDSIHEFPIGRFTPDIAPRPADHESLLLEHFDESDDFMPLFGCDIKAFSRLEHQL